MIKQILVIRSDLKMRRGKECAQAAHASMAWLTNRIRNEGRCKVSIDQRNYYDGVPLTEVEEDWLQGIFTKVCVRVDSEAELVAVYEKAKAAGITAELIEDAGLTEFKGVKTKTCCAIGPDTAEKLDAITGHLKLY